MLVMGMGAGGVKATIGPFIGMSPAETWGGLLQRIDGWGGLADQCTDDPFTISYTKSREKVVVDREATIEYIFNIYYCQSSKYASGASMPGHCQVSRQRLWKEI
ncbi:MAG: hypothetical protein LQ351_006053 [Letrouitia transgressa]|nr:MAG: hypothetical protein LQ351_006053 [Letrouitia transgressa]